MGPIERHLRFCSSFGDPTWSASWDWVIARIGTSPEARVLVYGASAWLNDGTVHGVSDMYARRQLPDVLTEAICAAEALCL